MLVYVDTDAPVPGDDIGAQAIFDRLRIDVVRSGETTPCSGCTRVIPLDTASFREGLSFGVGLAAGETGVRVRAVAYRSQAFPSGDPTELASLEATIEVPAVDDGEIRPVTLFLSTDETGASTSSLDNPRRPLEGAPVTSRVGTWPPAQPVGCSGLAHPGQVCVPGGAFWLAAPFGNQSDLILGTTNYQEQLVILSPFFMDQTEVTVATLRDSGFVTLKTEGLLAWSGDEDGLEPDFEGAFADWCTYSGALGRADLPVSCISYTTARAYCQSRGGDLPTEAQFSYVLGGTRSWLYPWGNDAPTCSDTNWGHGAEFDADGVSLVGACGTSGGEFFPLLPVATSARDRCVVPDGPIEDLAGNGTEYSLDTYRDRSDPCWAGPIVKDPICDEPHPASVVLRGGGLTSIYELSISTRSRAEADVNKEFVDAAFRCVRPGDDMRPPVTLPAKQWIGTGCATDDDCAAGDGICITESAHSVVLTGGVSGDGGAAGGYCSAKCSHDEDCGPGNLCEANMCLRSCSLNVPSQDARFAMLNPANCFGRRDQGCFTIPGNKHACLPLCGSNSQCPGRYCEPKAGFCGDTPPVGAPDGTGCTLDTDCAGYCRQVQSIKFCASACSLGGEVDSEDCGASHGQCLVPLNSGGPGSVGFCLAGCTAQSDCDAPALSCREWLSYIGVPNLAIPDHWNVAPGLCQPSTFCNSPGQSCGHPGEICTVTTTGTRCLDPSIPP